MGYRRNRGQVGCVRGVCRGVYIVRKMGMTLRMR